MMISGVSSQWLLYGFLLTVILSCYFFVRLKNHRKDSVIERASREDGLMEPSSLHPMVNHLTCIGCGACVNVCPTGACLSMVDDLDADPPVRKITLNYNTCIFCGNCSNYCTTEDGVNLSNQWDLAGLDRGAMSETHEFELQLCEKCGEVIGTKKHLVWLCEKLGPLAYTNPSLLISKSNELATKPEAEDISKQHKPDQAVQPSDFMRIMCPKCKCELNIRL